MIHAMIQGTDQVEIRCGSNCSHIYLFSDLQGGTPEDRAADLQSKIEAELDTRTPLSSLPDDDPDKTMDPAQPKQFWDGDDLIGKSIEVTVSPLGDGYNVVLRDVQS